jgi:hypothetical protein
LVAVVVEVCPAEVGPLRSGGVDQHGGGRDEAVAAVLVPMHARVVAAYVVNATIDVEVNGYVEAMHTAADDLRCWERRRLVLAGDRGDNCDESDKRGDESSHRFSGVRGPSTA